MRNTALNPPGRADERYSLPDFSFYIPFWIFMTGSVAGFVFEGIWSVIKKGNWEHHSATIWGPFCIIYGVGAVLAYALSYILRKQNVFMQFAAYLVAGSLVEYFFSLFQELCFGSVSWDYSAHFLNIGGRVSLKMTLIWGALGVVFAKFIFPHIMPLILSLKGNTAYTVTWILIVFMAVNLISTSLTVMRWRTRQNGAAPGNKVEQIVDSFYGDTKMEQLFPNMCFIENNKKVE